jgi:hypothetical protein
MRKFFVILVVAAGLLPVMTTASDATTPSGPFCVKQDGSGGVVFTDTFVWFVDSTAMGNQMMATGRDLTTGAAQTVSIFISGNLAHFAYTNSPDSSTGFPVIGGGSIIISGLFAGLGTGRCHRVNSGDGCGIGQPTNLTVITCPPDATTAPILELDTERMGEPG